MTPRVSVVMPVRKYTPYLLPAVNSILGQSMANLELIMVGYDNMKEWLHLLPADSRIRCHVRQKPGIIEALNEGLNLAQGEYIARMDADDLSMPHRLATQLTYLNNSSEIGIAGALVEFVSEDVSILAGNLAYAAWLNSLTQPIDISRDIFVESPLPHPTFFAHRDTWHKLGGYQDRGWPEDYDLLLRAHLSGVKFGKPASVLLRWREHQNRLTHHDPRYSRKQFLNAKAWALSKSVARGREVIICGTGRNARDLHDALMALDINTMSFVEHDAITTRTSKRHRPVISYTKLLQDLSSATRDFPLIISVLSVKSARDEFRQKFQAQGLIEPKDFVVAG